jgi:hypothetical protein
MFKKLILVMSTLLANACIVTAQSIPEFKNKVSVIKETALSDLEQTDLSIDLNTSPFTGTSKMDMKAMGKSSPVVTTTSSEYIVKLDSGTDPEAAVELFRFEVEKKSRKVNIGKAVMGKSTNMELPKVKLMFTKVQDGVYKITPAKPLERGEYVFVVERPNVDFMGAASRPRLKGFSFSL